jgi:hypothetical protein
MIETQKRTVPRAASNAIKISFSLYRVKSKYSEFFRTSSPQGTYTVSLTGQKGRPPLGLMNGVYFEVDKNGQPYVDRTYLHSGDTFDLSFEAGYPNHRWLSENVLQLYREEYFNKGKSDVLIVANKTTQPIRYMRVQSLDKFLIFDLPPSSTLELRSSPRRGDIRWVGAEGEFLNGQKIALKGVNFQTPKERGEAFTYLVNVTAQGLTIDSEQHLEIFESK